jgi:prepilin-type N-terminal cleavage/methylation domain-containing protein
MKTMRKNRKQQQGFTLLETMIAMVVLSFGILSIVSVYTQGLKVSAKGQLQFIAQAKAQEAMETIFTARDNHLLSWAQINNVSQGGVFLDGPQPLLAAGPDGFVGTADDVVAQPDTIIVGPPGNDDILSTSGDKTVNLNPMMTRTIAFAPVATTPNLNQITVTITYITQGQTNTYVLVCYISNYA